MIESREIEKYIILDFMVSRPTKARQGNYSSHHYHWLQLTLFLSMRIASTVLFLLNDTDMFMFSKEDQDCEVLYIAREAWPLA